MSSDLTLSIRNLRTETYAEGYGHVHFEDREGHTLGIRDADWEALGRPTYVVVTVRAEAFAESTQ